MSLAQLLRLYTTPPPTLVLQQLGEEIRKLSWDPLLVDEALVGYTG